jgi:hypothetical protein
MDSREFVSERHQRGRCSFANKLKGIGAEVGVVPDAKVLERTGSGGDVDVEEFHFRMVELQQECRRQVIN